MKVQQHPRRRLRLLPHRHVWVSDPIMIRHWEDLTSPYQLNRMKCTKCPEVRTLV